MRLLIAKARTDQARWRSIVDLAPGSVQFVDPWQLTPVASTPAQKTIWLNLDRYHAVLCVSPQAAKSLVQALDTFWPQPPAELCWLCNGPQTAAVLRSAGLTAVHPERGYTAEDVLQLNACQVKNDDHWLIVKGVGGRLTYAETLTQRGARVDSIEVYRRSLIGEQMADLALRAQQSDAIWISSEYFGQQLLASAPAFWQGWPGQWWVSSSRLAHWAQSQGLQTILQGQGATPEALYQLMISVAQGNAVPNHR
jgi:uroporphyrinogen-III synthase